MSLKKLFFALTLGFSLLTISIAVFLISVTHRMSTMSSEVTEAIESIRASEKLQTSLLDFSQTNAKDGSAALGLRQASVLKWLSACREHIASEDEALLVSRLENAVRAYLVSGNALEFQNTFDLAGTLTEMNVQSARTREDRAQVYSASAKTVGLLISLLALLATPLFWLTIRQWIYRPIESLRTSIQALNSTEPAPLHLLRGPKELRVVGQAFKDLSARLITQRESQLRFLASVAHDLRNPLGAIRMSSEILGDENLPNIERKNLVDIILRQASHLDRMVGDLLDASRIESGHLELRPSRQDLCRLVEDAVLLHQPLSKIHTLRFHSDRDHLWCDCDPLRISQVLNNLFNNAIKYSPNGGMIEADLKLEEGLAILRIKDQGLGVPLEDKALIFEPFRRTALTKLSIPGVGLGLSVSKRIAEGHGGSLEVESTSPMGSTFTLRLPAQGQELAIGSLRELSH